MRLPFINITMNTYLTVSQRFERGDDSFVGQLSVLVVYANVTSERHKDASWTYMAVPQHN